MSAAIDAMIDKAIKKVTVKRWPEYGVHQLRSKEWARVSKVMMKILDEAKTHGISRPLSKLQEVAYGLSFERPEDQGLQVVALWLTDTRIWMDEYMATKEPSLRELMELRGLLKPVGDAL